MKLELQTTRTANVSSVTGVPKDQVSIYLHFPFLLLLFSLYTLSSHQVLPYAWFFI